MNEDVRAMLLQQFRQEMGIPTSFAPSLTLGDVYIETTYTNAAEVLNAIARRVGWDVVIAYALERQADNT